MELRVWENPQWQPKGAFLTGCCEVGNWPNRCLISWVCFKGCFQVFKSLVFCLLSQRTLRCLIDGTGRDVRSGDPLVFSVRFSPCPLHAIYLIYNSFFFSFLNVRCKCVQVFSFCTHWKGFHRTVFSCALVVVVVAAVFTIPSNRVCLKPSGWSRISCCCYLV